VEPLTRGLQPPDLRSLCPLSSTDFVAPPAPKKFLAKTPSPLKINPRYAIRMAWWFLLLAFLVIPYGIIQHNIDNAAFPLIIPSTPLPPSATINTDTQNGKIQIIDLVLLRSKYNLN
jgi:hypothetical protein